MQKISFGSFPFINLRREDRQCLDRYLIKNFSDMISISDSLRNLTHAKSIMYITPDQLMKSWLLNAGSNNESQKISTTTTHSDDRTSTFLYNEVLKRAFYITKQFYSKLKNAPFYNNFIYYPIYVEKIEKIQVYNTGDTGYSTSMTNYSFILLSNDLTRNLKLDEIRFDENATVNFLFLFIEFFSDTSSPIGKSIHDFDQNDYEFLIKLYQFIEKSNKSPIELVIDLYKLIGLMYEIAKKEKSISSIKTSIIQKTNEIDTDILQKYKGMLKHEFIQLLKKNSLTTDKRTLRDAFVKLMNAIFKSEQLSGLFDGVESDAARAERYVYFENSNKYREILTLAKELVEYNRLNCKNIITDDKFDFDFKIEHGGRQLTVKKQIIAQKYQEYFKTYVESLKDYFDLFIKNLINELGILKKVNDSVQFVTADGTTVNGLPNAIKYWEQEIRDLESQLKITENQKKHYQRSLLSISATLTNLQKTGQYGTPAWTTENANYKKINAFLTAANNRIDKLKTDLEFAKNNLTMFLNLGKTVQSKLTDKNDALIKRLNDRLFTILANDLTFLYDDGKKFFTSEPVALGYIELQNKGLNVGDPSDFETIAKSPSYPKEENAFYTQVIIKAIDTDAEALADDTLDFINENLVPALLTELTNEMGAPIGTSGAPLNIQIPNKPNVNDVAENVLKRVFANLTPMSESQQQQFRNVLYEKIFRNRFIKFVLHNFDRLFSVRETNEVIAFDEKLSNVHPIIKKLVGNDQKCNYFKSFILTFEICEQLFNIKYIAEQQKFLSGITNKPPRQFSSPLNRIEKVLIDYLGLKNNPVWIISKQNVYLSMPDDFSLTGTSILNKVAKSEMMQVCKIRPSDYWNETNMGKIASFGNKKIIELQKKLKTAERVLQDRLDEYRKCNNIYANDPSKLKNCQNNAQSKINSAEAAIKKIENEIEKLKHDIKQYKPNAFLFNEPDESTELLTPDEEKNLIQNRLKMEKNLIGDYSKNDIEKETTQFEKEKKTIDSENPFDFIEDDKSSQNEEDLNDFERFMRERELARKREDESDFNFRNR